MTAVEVSFSYGADPGEREMASLNRIWEVYGIRRIELKERERTIRVEYDATRLDEAMVAALLRGAGIDVQPQATPA